MLVSEIFKSIQGESTYAGLPCVFVRLAGCNLRCDWCDTVYAQSAEGGAELSEEEIVDKVLIYDNKLVELSGGEPLAQEDTASLASKLIELEKTVLIETNGSLSLKDIDSRAVKIVDVKTPSSGHEDSFLLENLKYIDSKDEIKFVVADRADYDFACAFIEEHLKEKKMKLLISPLAQSLDPAELATWILKDNLQDVRLQLQLHKLLWPDGEEGIS